MTIYKLQRWWVPTTGLVDNGWETKKVFHDPEEALHAYHGWCRQIVDGSFQVVNDEGTILVARHGTLYKQTEERDQKVGHTLPRRNRSTEEW